MNLEMHHTDQEIALRQAGKLEKKVMQQFDSTSSNKTDTKKLIKVMHLRLKKFSCDIFQV